MWPVVKVHLQTPMMFASMHQQKEETTEGQPTQRMQEYPVKSGLICSPTWEIIISAEIQLELQFLISGAGPTLDLNHVQFPFALLKKCLTSPLTVMGNLIPMTATLMPLKN